ncbi:hypothetical protein MKEN_00163000 [Mycena kentingensis (nom. inval.)]|nr:hypothetical protein MKEN_00163000 [Mycena kentingensis (nom. inval.)]
MNTTSDWSWRGMNTHLRGVVECGMVGCAKEVSETAGALFCADDECCIEGCAKLRLYRNDPQRTRCFDHGWKKGGDYWCNGEATVPRAKPKLEESKTILVEAS